MTHEPNVPRTHNTKGQKVDEPVQCVQCLQTWPCEYQVLIQENTALLRMNHDLRREVTLDGLDAFYADCAFLEVNGSTATKVRAAVWAWHSLAGRELSLNEIRAFLVESGFELVSRPDDGPQAMGE